MPTYEYECTRCGLVTEEFKSMSAKPRQRCPACRGKVNRLISGGMGIVFKGSGFYQNDSRPKRSGAGDEASSASGDSSRSPSAGNDNSTAGKNKG
jgi:putative FmdB family regulatory protein